MCASGEALRNGPVPSSPRSSPGSPLLPLFSQFLASLPRRNRAFTEVSSNWADYEIFNVSGPQGNRSLTTPFNAEFIHNIATTLKKNSDPNLPYYYVREVHPRSPLRWRRLLLLFTIYSVF